MKRPLSATTRPSILRVEDYLRRFPVLNKPVHISELAAQEYRARHQFGDRPGPEEFERRFPGLLPGNVDLSRAPGSQPATYDFLAPAQGPGELGRLGAYRVVEVLGSGGMGVVFRAEDMHLQRPVALKAMLPGLARSPTARQRFLREARAAAAIKHHHIVSIYQVGEDQGAPFLAMEFLEGEALDDRLKRASELPVAEIVRIGRQIAEGLAAAHDRGLIHRDIKPANIWLEGNQGWVKILDFGLARAVADQTHLTQTGAILGTPAFMAPEQATGKDTDHRCDLFSLGGVLYRMCTGRLPFPGPDAIAILYALATEVPDAPVDVNPNVPVELSALIMHLLEKKPNDRPASAQSVIDALRPLESDPTMLLVAKSSPRLKPKKQTTAVKLQARAVGGWRRPALVMAATAGLVLIAFWLFRQMLSTGPTPDQPGPADKEKPFLLIRTGSERRDFANLDALLNHLQSGDVVEVHGNGPFKVGLVRTGVGLTMRAGSGYRPQFEPGETALGQQAWFTLDNAPLVIEGCDFRGRGPTGHFFAGGGAPWRIANCRIFKFQGPILDYAGPKVRLEDNLVCHDCASTVSVFVLGPGVRAELDSNVICAGSRANLFAFKKGGQELTLLNNSIWAGQGLTPNKLDEPVNVEAQGNILEMSGGLMPYLSEPPSYHWRGKRNLYVGAALSVKGADGKAIVKDLAGWGKLSQDVEIGSRESVSVLPKLAEGLALEPATAVSVYERFLEAARRDSAEKDFGPDLNVIGPGDAYVRSMRASNKPTRQEPPAGGPFALTRKGKNIRTISRRLSRTAQGV